MASRSGFGRQKEGQADRAAAGREAFIRASGALDFPEATRNNKAQ